MVMLERLENAVTARHELEKRATQNDCTKSGRNTKDIGQQVNDRENVTPNTWNSKWIRDRERVHENDDKRD